MKIKIDNKAFIKTLFTLVIPMALQNLINVGVQSADVVMLSMTGAESEVNLSAASLAGQVQFVMMLIFFGLASGASVLNAQYWGKGDKRSIEKVFSITLRISMTVAVLFFLAAELIPGSLMRIFTNEQAVIDEGIKYLRFVAPGYLIVGFTNLYLMLMRSVERVVISVTVVAVALVSNIILNATFIFGLFGLPAMGVAGAAFATTLSRVIELVIVVIYATRNKDIRMRFKDYVTVDKVLLKDFIRYAGPTILNEMLWGISMSTYSVIIGRMGTAAVAANSVGSVVRQLATVVAMGVANAAAIMIGKAIGAGEPEKARAYAPRLALMGLVTGALGGGVILIIRPFVVKALDLTPQAQQYLLFLLLVLSLYVIAQAYSAVMVVGIFRGGGDPRFGLFMDFGTMWGGSILWGALAAFVFKAPVEVVLLLLFSDEFLKVPLCTLRYRSKRWLKNVTREETDIVKAEIS